MNILERREDAQDILQEAFLKAKENFSSFNTEKSFSSWFFKIVSNLCKDHLRKRSTQEVSLETLKESYEENEKLVLLDKNPNPLETLERKEEKEIFRKAISSLPSQYEEVLTLRLIEELSIKETAQTLKIAQGTVMSRLYRGKELLRKRIKSYLKKGV